MALLSLRKIFWRDRTSLSIGADDYAGVRFIAEAFNDGNSRCAEPLYCDSATWTPAVAQCFSAGGTQPRAANQFTAENIAPATILDRLQCAALDVLIRLHVGLPECSVSLRKRISLVWIDHGGSGNALDTGAL